MIFLRGSLQMMFGCLSTKAFCNNFIRFSSNSFETPPNHLIFFGSDAFSIAVFREFLTEYRLNLKVIEACVVSSKVMFSKFLSAYHPDVKIHVWPDLPQVSIEEDQKFALVASFGKLIPESFLQRLPDRIINVHPSLLPRWRGAAPLNRCIIEGDPVVGVSIVQVAPRHFDVGKVYIQQEVEKSTETKVNQLGDQLATLGARLLLKHVLPDLELSAKNAIQQANLPYKSRLAKRVKPAEIVVDWKRMDASKIFRLHAATITLDRNKQEMGQLKTTFQGNPIRLIQIDPFPGIDFQIYRESRNPDEIKPGSAVLDNKHRNRLLIKSQNGWVSVRRLMYKKPMSAQDFWNGYLSKRPENEHYFE